jgi:hypothetical protein
MEGGGWREEDGEGWRGRERRKEGGGGCRLYCSVAAVAIVCIIFRSFRLSWSLQTMLIWEGEEGGGGRGEGGEGSGREKREMRERRMQTLLLCSCRGHRVHRL